MTPLLRVFLPLAIAYGLTLVWCVERWNAPSGSFQHCWLVPPVAAWLCWQRRASWSALPATVDPRGWWLLGPALLLHLAGALLMIDSWSAASLVLAIPGAAWLALGAPRTRALLPILCFLWFAVPLPMYVEGRLAFELKELAVAAGPAIANLFGADVVRSGDHLQLRGMDGALYVADACGGVRSLLATVTLAYCLAFLFGAGGLWRRVLLLLLAPALAVLANIVRIAALCLLARSHGVPFAEGTGHDLANAAEWIALVGALLLVDALLRRWLPAKVGAAKVAPPTWPRNQAGGHARIAAALLWGTAPLLLLFSGWRPFTHGAGRAAALPTAVAGYALVERTPAQQERFAADLPRWRELLGTDDFVWRHYRDTGGHWISLVALFHDANWKSVHPPRICIEGSGMVIEVDDLIAAPWLGDGVQASRILARRRDNGMRFVTLSLFGGADWLAGDYWDFVWRHLPRALLRANLSGFLLRVEAAVAPGEDAAAAEARAGAFLRAIVGPAQEVLR